MTRKMPTIDLKGNEYATVPTRIKLFREDTVNGSIKTEQTFQEDGTVVFTATIIKDLDNPNSANATGHSFGKVTSDKAFEKLETIAVGRALANLGYLASGAVASFEEMEDYQEHLREQKTEAIVQAIDTINTAGTIEELQEVWQSLGVLIKEPEVVAAKDERKEILNEDSTN